jgi:hypothetical protein
MRIDKKERFLITIFIAIILSTTTLFVRYLVFSKFTVYTNERDISESIPDQFYNVINEGL